MRYQTFIPMEQFVMDQPVFTDEWQQPIYYLYPRSSYYCPYPRPLYPYDQHHLQPIGATNLVFGSGDRVVTLPEITIYGIVPKPDQAAYNTADEAGMAAISFIILKSRIELREYAGWVYQNPTDNKYYFSIPRRGDADTSNPGPRPRGMKVIGTYHTHGGRPLGQSVASDEIFSPDDKVKATLGKYISYLGTPKGRILRYTPIDLLPNEVQAQYPTGFVEILFDGIIINPNPSFPL